jgi:hypothetical protein
MFDAEMACAARDGAVPLFGATVLVRLARNHRFDWHGRFFDYMWVRTRRDVFCSL